MNNESLFERWANRIQYEWMKLMCRYWWGQIGHFHFDDSYRFYCFILIPDRYRGDYHRVIREYETFLVWRIGNWFLIIE